MSKLEDFWFVNIFQMVCVAAHKMFLFITEQILTQATFPFKHFLIGFATECSATFINNKLHERRGRNVEVET